jgi:uncharacterized membrane protein YfcA
MERLIVVGVVGLVAQFVDGTLGMGYGAFSASFLIAGGVLPVIASASIHTAEIFTTLFSGGFHLWFGNVKKEWLLPLVVPGIVGGAAGAYFLSSIPGNTMKPFIAGFLLLLGIIVLYRFWPRRVPALGSDPPNQRNSSRLANSRAKLPVLGFTSAFVDAVGGGGWGPIATPGLILTEDSEPRKVVGTVNLAEFFITVAISATFFATLGWELYRWDLVGALLIGGVIAAPIAAYLCKRLPTRALGVLVGLALIGFNLRTLVLTVAG